MKKKISRLYIELSLTNSWSHKVEAVFPSPIFDQLRTVPRFKRNKKQREFLFVSVQEWILIWLAAKVLLDKRNRCNANRQCWNINNLTLKIAYLHTMQEILMSLSHSSQKIFVLFCYSESFRSRRFWCQFLNFFFQLVRKSNVFLILVFFLKR